jgi:hypothetical protein
MPKSKLGRPAPTKSNYADAQPYDYGYWLKCIATELGTIAQLLREQNQIENREAKRGRQPKIVHIGQARYKPADPDQAEQGAEAGAEVPGYRRR